MKISGPCEECKKKPAIVGLGQRLLCLDCFQAELDKHLRPVKGNPK